MQIHRLITEGTLEDRIASLLEKKRELAEAVVGSQVRAGSPTCPTRNSAELVMLRAAS